MKVGDLVELSAKGSQRKANTSYLGGVGILMEIVEGRYYDLGILWTTKNGHMNNGIKWFKRYEIRKMKTDKKCP